MSEHTKQSALNSDRGFTLLEVMIALFIFTIGILATTSMQISSLHGNKIANDTTEASAIAASWVENLKSLDYDQDAELQDGDFGPFTVGQYNLTYNIERGSIIDNTMSIRVTVNWTERGTPKTIDLDYVKSDVF